MSLTSGTRLGPYEIVAPLGAGGMGEVYRGRDTQLKRDVALKVLPAAFSTDGDRLARFQREAEVLATLNHPHIAAIYGLERSATATALILELVDGETLADRIARGPIPIEEAIPIARQIADALESAHDRGIIHRDLKPANVKVRPDGTVKVLDFGLAKALDEEGPESDGSHAASLSPTMTSPAMTRLGIILGTAAYMSPEQARGRPADRRSDVWAFGCVLYEMLTGKSIFGSNEVSDTLAAVLRAEPDWNALPAETPPRIRLLLQRCLRKDARQRLPHIGAARLDLDDALAFPDATSGDARPSHVRARWAWVFAAAASLAAVALVVPAARHLAESPRIAAQQVLAIPTPSTSEPTSFSLSPDGQQIVYSAETDGRRQLWLRKLSEQRDRPLEGTEGGRSPFWSPDSRSIGFFTGSHLLRLDLAGGGARRLAPVSAGAGGSWNRNNEIIYVAGMGIPLNKISADSANRGDVTTALAFDNGLNGHRFPHFLPDQRHYLLYGVGTRSGVYLASLDSPGTKWLTEADAGCAFVPAVPTSPDSRTLVPGWVLYSSGGTLFARAFDPVAKDLTGDPIVVSERILYLQAPNFGAALSVSASGSITYRVGETSPRRLVWFDANGKLLSRLELADSTFTNPQVSPDGRIAVERFLDNNTDVWVFDGPRGRKLTVDAARDYFPVWSEEGRMLLFASIRSTRERPDAALWRIFKRASDGSTSEVQIVDSTIPMVPLDVSPDGRSLLYFTENSKGGTATDIGVRSLADGKQTTLLGGAAKEMWAQFSPDGGWVAYQSDESGDFEIYIAPFPGPGASIPVSLNGGIQPRWSRNRRELYYISPDGSLMAVSITFTGASATPGTPRGLFRPGIVGGGIATAGLRQQYDVDATGRFLVNVYANEAAAPPIWLLQNADAFRRKP